MALATRRKPSTTRHKKLSGRHHRHSKPYLKAYWPYLPMLLVVALGLIVNSLWADSRVLGTQSNFSSENLLEATNLDRSQQQLSSLSIDPALSAAAQAKANDMVQRNYWSHTSPDGRTPWSFIAAAGYSYAIAGENLAYGFNGASEVVAGWMNSPEHRANVLNPDYQNVGFGVASSPNFRDSGPETIVVAEYGRAVPAVATVSFSVPNPVTSTVKGANTELATRPVARIQLLTGGNASWSLVAVSALAGAALAFFIFRQGFRIKRALGRGEAFVAHHPLLDLLIIIIITAGYILTRTGGLIR